MQKSFLLKMISGVVLLASSAMAGTVTFNYSGNFTGDDGEAFINITLPSTETLTAYTTDGAIGGFWSILTMYQNSDGSQVWPIPNGAPSCGAGLAPFGPGPTDCNDAGASQPWNAGAYTMVLTQWQNNPLGSLTDGFAQFGNNYTAGANGCSPGTLYCDDPLSPAKSYWALVIKFDTAGGGGSSYDARDSYNTTVNSATPEPGTVLLSLSGLAGLIAVRRKRA